MHDMSFLFISCRLLTRVTFTYIYVLEMISPNTYFEKKLIRKVGSLPNVLSLFLIFTLLQRQFVCISNGLDLLSALGMAFSQVHLTYRENNSL